MPRLVRDDRGIKRTLVAWLREASMDRQKIQNAIRLLDDEVPRENARVRFEQYGGGSRLGSQLSRHERERQHWY